jgi:membrane-associated phospholipid phosphatase
MVIAGLLWVYDAVSNLASLQRVAAVDHARSAWGLERHLHVDLEYWLNHWLAGHHLLGLWVSDYYDNAHFVVTLGVVGWLWWRHPSQYRPLRTSLVMVNLCSFVIYWLYPMAPPRLVPGGHIVDVVATTHAFGSWHAGTLASVGNANELGAMPSVHIAWALWSAWAVWLVFRDRRGATLVFAYPVVTAVAVVATGNHFVVDVVAGALVMVVATVAADRIHLNRDPAQRAARAEDPAQRAARARGTLAPAAGGGLNRRSLPPTNDRPPGPPGGSSPRPARAGSELADAPVAPTTAPQPARAQPTS